MRYQFKIMKNGISEKNNLDLHSPTVARKVQQINM